MAELARELQLVRLPANYVRNPIRKKVFVLLVYKVITSPEDVNKDQK